MPLSCAGTFNKHKHFDSKIVYLLGLLAGMPWSTGLWHKDAIQNLSFVKAQFLKKFQSNERTFSCTMQSGSAWAVQAAQTRQAIHETSSQPHRDPMADHATQVLPAISIQTSRGPAAGANGHIFPWVTHHDWPHFDQSTWLRAFVAFRRNSWPRSATHLARTCSAALLPLIFLVRRSCVSTFRRYLATSCSRRFRNFFGIRSRMSTKWC